MSGDRGRFDVVVVDDEPLARRSVRAGLERHPDMRLAGEAGDGEEAVRVVRETAPDALFLDVRMPGRDGFDVLAALGDDAPEAVVFVTAYDDRAVDAFDVRAVDYLVKPFEDDRFDEAVERLRERLATREADGSGAGRGGGGARSGGDASGGGADDREGGLRGRGRARPSRLVLREGEAIRFVEVADVRWLESDGHHVIVHGAGGAHRVRAALSAVAERLDPGRFVRIHRSTVVNLDHVRQLLPQGSGDWEAVLGDGTRLRVSRHYRDDLMRRVT